eukprot:TRINITY_DN51630_c0_g1_i1.p1 TRINITY_DN51630_c0_g1~~TRINITY_DN51630_c0_g1_i1.p1  ORF type:complete len:457 (+),score=101.39 TRINITY_DN51630_c0_g1_i1:64-1434(+)
MAPSRGWMMRTACLAFGRRAADVLGHGTSSTGVRRGVSGGMLRTSRMLSAPRDAYAVLGLERSASNDEVKARFRELAKKQHPDLNKDRSASVKMAELTTAYDTLMDAKKRAALDQALAGTESGPGGTAPRSWSGTQSGFGRKPSDEWVDPSQMFSEFQDIFGRDGGQRPPGTQPAAARGEDIGCELQVSFLEAMQGADKSVSLMAKQTCPDCRGSGAKPGTGWSTCKVCKGTGVHRVERGILSMGVPCQRCQGQGEVLDHPCRNCKGDGVRLQPREVRVSVPAGVRNLMELRVPGAGHAGFRGGKAGHLFVTCKVQPHDSFRHVDDDVHLDVPLTLRQALLGGELEIPTLRGEKETLVVQAGTQPGATKVIRGRGPPRLGGEGRGHLVLRFLLQLPVELSERQVQLIEEFDQLTTQEAGARAAAAAKSAAGPRASQMHAARGGAGSRVRRPRAATA